jgi:hypothetical protein
MAANKTSIVLTADDKTRAAFDSARRNLDGLTGVAGKLNTVLGAVGVSASLGGLAAFVKGSIDAADNMRDLAIATGTSVEALARYQLAAKQSGTDIETVAKSMGKLSVYMAKNSEEAASLGITARDPAQALAQLADVLAQVEDPAQRNALAMKVLGRSYADVMPLLAQGGDELRKQADAAGPYAKRMADLADKADRFNDSLAALAQQGSAALLPMVDAFLDMADAATQAGEGLRGFDAALAGFGQAGAVGQTVAVVWANVSYVFKQVGVEIGGIAAQIAALGRLDFKGAGTIGKMMKEDAAKSRAELDALEKRIMTFKATVRAPTQSAAMAKTGGAFAGLLDDSDKKKRAAAAKTPALDQIDPYGKQRQQAEAEALRKTVEAQNAAFDAMADMRNDQIAQDEKAAASLGRMREAMIDIIDPIQRYREELDKVDALVEAGLFTPEQAAAARLYWQEQMDAAAGFGKLVQDDAKKTADIGRELGMTFTSAFEDAVIAGKDFQSVLESIGQDITRIFLRKMVTEPLADAVSGLFKGFDFGSIFGGARATGGPVAGGTAYLVGERGPELFVPKNAGNIVPNAAAQGSRAVVINMNVQASDAGSFRRSMGQIKADLAFAVGSAQRNM